MRVPNSHECKDSGRKLSDLSCDDIEVNPGYVCIGSDDDDEIYSGECLQPGEKMLKERVKIFAMDEPEDGSDGHYVEIDLEDVLIFAAKNCRRIYERVLEENR